MTFKKAVVFFACEASEDGKELGWELKIRARQLAEELRGFRYRDAHVCFARSASGFNPPGLYSELLADFLWGHFAGNYARIFGDSASTASEIDAAEALLREQPPEYDEVFAASSDYHVPRIVKLWQIRHSRTVKPLPLPVPRTWYIRKRMLLEYPKLMLLYAPAWMQDVLGHVMRRFKMI